MKLIGSPRGWLSLVICVLSGLPCATWAQWETIQATVDEKTFRAALNYNSGKPTADVDGPTAIRASCQAFIAEFTQPYNDKDKLPNFRNTWYKIEALLNEPRQAPEARPVLIGTLAALANTVAADAKYSPAARINCVSLLSELDDERDPRRGTRKPSLRALRSLLDLLAAETTPGYLKAVALQGLERHARDGWENWRDQVKAPVNATASKYAKNKPPRDADRELNTWLARRALDILRVAKSKDAIDSALEYLGDADELPSLRLAALQYLTVQDVSQLTPDQKSAYALGLTHFLRSQLVQWYLSESDKLRRSGGQLSGGYSGGGMRLGGMMGGDSSGDSEPASSFPGRARPPRGTSTTTKPIETQDWQARASRRLLNDVTQSVRMALEGRRIEDEAQQFTTHLTAAETGLDPRYNLDRLIGLVNDLQTNINDAQQVTTLQSLMNLTKPEIEAVMRFAKTMPGFLERYPQKNTDDDDLEEVQEEPLAPEQEAQPGDEPVRDQAAVERGGRADFGG